MSEETIPQMRETIERLSKDKAGLQTQVDELSGQLRVRDAREAFRAEGYDPKQGDLFAASNPEGEITAEAVNEFAGSFNLQPVAAESQEGESKAADEGDPAPQAPAGSTGLAPAAGGGSLPGDSGSGGPGVKKMTRAEWQNLAATDPAAARAAVASGRVEISGDNPWTGTQVPAGNPYVPVVQGKS